MAKEKEINPRDIKNSLDVKISMVAAASEVLAFKKKNPSFNSDKILAQVAKKINKDKDELTKRGMIAAMSEALSMTEKKPPLTEKEILKRVVDNLPGLLENRA